MKETKGATSSSSRVSGNTDVSSDVAEAPDAEDPIEVIRDDEGTPTATASPGVTTSTMTTVIASTTNSGDANQTTSSSSDSQAAEVPSRTLAGTTSTCSTAAGSSSSSSSSRSRSNDDDNSNDNDKNSSGSIHETETDDKADSKTTNVNTNVEENTTITDALNNVNTALAVAMSAKDAQGAGDTIEIEDVDGSGKKQPPRFFAGAGIRPEDAPILVATPPHPPRDDAPSVGIGTPNQTTPGVYQVYTVVTPPPLPPPGPEQRNHEQPQEARNAPGEPPSSEALPPNDGTPVAKPVDDVVEIRDYIIEVEEPRRQPNRRMRWVWPTTMFAAVLVGIVLAILLPPWGTNQVENNNNNNNNNNGEPPPAACSRSNLPDKEYVKQCLLPNYSISAMEQDQSSPQALAFQWVMNDPNLHSYKDWRILQRYALATFYYSTNGDNWVAKKGWLNHSVHECEWDDYSDEDLLGVKDLILEVYSFDVELIPIVLETMNSLQHHSPCGEESEIDNGVYQHVWQSNNRLKGTLPPELFLLTNVKSMLLAFSDIEGTVPSQIGQLTNLEQLVTWRVGLRGTIPTEVGMLSNLSVMVDFTSFLSGVIPREIEHLTNIKVLSILENQLTGVPTEIGLLSKLKALDFGKNKLLTIPTEFGQLTSLTALGLYSNELQDFPSSLFSLTALESLGMWSNPLTTTIPTDIGILTRLKQLILYHTSLTGSLPSEIGLLSNLKYLRLGDNHLAGEIPKELFDLAMSGSMVDLNVTGNILLEGTIPDGVCDAGVFLFNCSSRLCGCACKCPALNGTM